MIEVLKTLSRLIQKCNIHKSSATCIILYRYALYKYKYLGHFKKDLANHAQRLLNFGIKDKYMIQLAKKFIKKFSTE